MSQFKVVSV